MMDPSGQGYERRHFENEKKRVNFLLYFPLPSMIQFFVIQKIAQGDDVSTIFPIQRQQTAEN